jgi:hypothetical protein
LLVRVPARCGTAGQSRTALGCASKRQITRASAAVCAECRQAGCCYIEAVGCGWGLRRRAGWPVGHGAMAGAQIRQTGCRRDGCADLVPSPRHRNRTATGAAAVCPALRWTRCAPASAALQDSPATRAGADLPGSVPRSRVAVPRSRWPASIEHAPAVHRALGEARACRFWSLPMLPVMPDSSFVSRSGAWGVLGWEGE